MKCLVGFWFALMTGPLYAQLITEHPKIEYKLSPETSLQRVEITQKYTIIHCAFLKSSSALDKLFFLDKRLMPPDSIYILIGRDTRLIDRQTRQGYRLLKAVGIPIIGGDSAVRRYANTLPLSVPLNKKVTYSLYFEKLPPGVTLIDLVEPPLDGFSSPFSFLGIKINNPPLEKPAQEKPVAKKEPPVVSEKPVKEGPTTQKATKPIAKEPDNVALTKTDTLAKPVTSLTGKSLNEGETLRLENLTFAQGKYELLPSSFAELDQLAEMMSNRPSMEILLEGHTDNIGSPVENMKLSQDRVRAVKTYLTQKKIAADRIQTKAYGSTKPLVVNGSPEQRKANRRVELKVLKK